MFCTGNFLHKKISHQVISHSGLKIEREISHASRIVPPMRFLHDLDLNPRPQAHLPLVAVQPVSSNFEEKIRPSVCKWSFS